MSTRSLEQEADLRAAADYVKVYTRPIGRPDTSQDILDKGCFDCRHVKPNMSPGRYTTIFGMLVQENADAPPKIRKAFGITVSFNDKAWSLGDSMYMRLDRGAYNKFPMLPNAYRLVEDILNETEKPYVRLLSQNEESTRHVNSRIDGEELLVDLPYEAKNDLVMISQPQWGNDLYIDPSTPVDKRQITVADLRFRTQVAKDRFEKDWVSGNGLNLTIVEGNRKKSRKKWKPV